MNMLDFIPGLIMGFREGLEAFLIIAILLEYLNKTDGLEKKKFVYQGLVVGILASLVFGLVLFGFSVWIDNGSTSIVKLWEIIASFAALVLITTFILIMIKHKNSIVQKIEDRISVAVTSKAIILLTSIMVAREGAEIALFIFASTDQVSYLLGTVSGLILSAGLTYLIYKSLVRVNLKMIFSVTLLYLILQAGFMLGYSFHELFSWFKAESIIDSSHWIYSKMFDLSDTFLYHKTKPLGILLYVTIGWYSKPEVVQFIIQYGYTISLAILFFRNKGSKKK